MDYSRDATQPSWFFSDVITITSHTGVGSTTTLKKLREAFAHDGRKRFVSGGQIMRDVAASLRMTIEEFAAYNKEHPDAGYDKRCDDEIRAYGSQNHTIIEGRLPHAFVPHGFHVKLTCPVSVRAERRACDGEGKQSVLDVLRKIEERDANDDTRYAKLYKGSLWRDQDFNLVLDTSLHVPDQATSKILLAHDEWKRDAADRLCHTIVAVQ
jgi:cytidylate kinase